MNRLEELTVIGLSLSGVGMVLSSQGDITTPSGAGGVALMCAAMAVLLYVVLKSEENSGSEQ